MSEEYIAENIASYDSRAAQSKADGIPLEQYPY